MSLSAIVTAAMLATTPMPCPGPDAGCGSLQTLEYRISEPRPVVEVRRRRRFRSWGHGGSGGSASSEEDWYWKTAIAVVLIGGATLFVKYADFSGGRGRRSAGPRNYSTACPKCGASMVLRQAARGRGSGRQFWGCSTFPACRGTRRA